MKRMLVTLLTALMCVAVLAGCAQAPVESAPVAPVATEEPAAAPAEELAPEPTEEPAAVEPVYARMITEIPADADLDTIMLLENRNCKNITAVKPVLDSDTFSAYSKAVTKMKKDKTMEAAQAAVAARAGILQNDDALERIWYLWDADAMPVKDGESFTEEDIDKSQMFGYGFTPLVIAFLLDDPASAKGNIVACSGGGMKVWANGAEGFPAAGVFNDLGYNVFLLQRRVEPYGYEDISIDYQRAIRMVRYHAVKDGYGHTDMIAGVGWSGGSGTLMGSVFYLYGDVMPTVYDTDYVPDEIDAISADLDVAMPIYGGDWIPMSNNYPSIMNETTVNPDLVIPVYDLVRTLGNKNLPAFYIVHGTEDATVPTQASIDLYDAVKDIVPAELNLIEGADHGFGVGLAPATGQAPGTELWPAQADAFMQANYGHSGN